jgi:DNA repair exonuclease SbcCD ATPase subunit
MHSTESTDSEVSTATDVCRELRPPTEARRRTDRLTDKRDDRVTESRRMAGRFDQLNAYLALADKVTVALEQLNQELFQQLLGIVQEKLTVALQEILEQPIHFRAQADFKRGATTVEFWIERDGNREDVLRGQGGSVANILSVGLRMFALTTLDEQQHRRFLVLDEQDCWLRPDLVPRLVKIVHEAGAALGFQVLMISHHDVALFERYADRIYQFSLDASGEIQVRPLTTSPSDPDRMA